MSEHPTGGVAGQQGERVADADELIDALERWLGGGGPILMEHEKAVVRRCSEILNTVRTRSGRLLRWLRDLLGRCDHLAPPLPSTGLRFECEREPGHDPPHSAFDSDADRVEWDNDGRILRDPRAEFSGREIAVAQRAASSGERVTPDDTARAWEVFVAKRWPDGGTMRHVEAREWAPALRAVLEDFIARRSRSGLPLAPVEDVSDAEVRVAEGLEREAQLRGFLARALALLGAIPAGSTLLDGIVSEEISAAISDYEAARLTRSGIAHDVAPRENHDGGPCPRCGLYTPTQACRFGSCAPLSSHRVPVSLDPTKCPKCGADNMPGGWCGAGCGILTMGGVYEARHIERESHSAEADR